MPWGSAKELTDSFNAMSESARIQLRQLYNESRVRFSPLSDPLDVSFHLHRQLADSREEVYSDWFQWVLEYLADPKLIAEVLAMPEKVRQFGNAKEPFYITREEKVEHGHQDQSERLDIVIRQGVLKLAVIEIKTRDYSDVDLLKHKGYSACVEAGTDLIFVAVNKPDSDLSGFRFVAWADICMRLRKIAVTMLRPQRILSTALTLAFVGAVEQSLLGLCSPEGDSFSLGKVPRTVDHLFNSAAKEN